MGLFDGPPVTDAQRELVAKTDARTREWYLEAEIAMLNMRIAELEAALKPFVPDTDINAEEYTSVWNNHLIQARKALGECGE